MNETMEMEVAVEEVVELPLEVLPQVGGGVKDTSL